MLQTWIALATTALTGIAVAAMLVHRVRRPSPSPNPVCSSRETEDAGTAVGTDDLSSITSCSLPDEDPDGGGGS